MTILLAFDNDGVLRDESVSYQRCVVETVAFFNKGIPPSEKELTESMKQSTNDWESTHKILQQRGVSIGFKRVKEHFQDLYLGKERNFSGYINDEPWLADNSLLAKLAAIYPLAIVSGAPIGEIRYALRRNNALDYFSGIWGMFECNGKKDGLEKAIAKLGSKKVFFCDDKPSPIKEAIKLSNHNEIYVFGIIPPQEYEGWEQVLKDAGAIQVFPNVKEYCQFLIDCRCKIE